MNEKKTSDAQLKASRKWQEENKTKMRHIRNRSGAKSYIKEATLDELGELQELIDARRTALKE